MAAEPPRSDDPRALRVSNWRGDRRVALLSSTPDRPSPSAAAIAREIERLRKRSTQRVVTGALQVQDLDPFLANGFSVRERLHLLRHDLVELPGLSPHRPQPRLRRMRRFYPKDRATVLDIDARAFDPFWNLDRAGFIDAIRATPTSRVRVCRERRQPISGYAITGLAQNRGYLQRLAVDPDHHRSGIGRALVVDALRWLTGNGAQMAVVNTQTVNTAAYELYLSCGFELEPSGLTVLELDLRALG